MSALDKPSLTADVFYGQPLIYPKIEEAITSKYTEINLLVFYDN